MQRWVGAACVIAAIIATAGCTQGRSASRVSSPPPTAVRDDAALSVIQALAVYQGGMSASTFETAGRHPRFTERDLLNASAFIRSECAPTRVHYQLALWTSDEPVPYIGYPIEVPVWVVTCQDLHFAATAGGVNVPTTWIYEAHSGKLLSTFSFRAPTIAR